MSTKQISGPYKYRANIYIPENIPNKKKRIRKENEQGYSLYKLE